mmetsp:Transcript_72964/g.205555  ORF Transcript_72964/g.205555 Transcript_72964/m.205555 type:complete len:275 (-) Transcript_72964:61-885(-)
MPGAGCIGWRPKFLLFLQRRGRLIDSGGSRRGVCWQHRAPAEDRRDVGRGRHAVGRRRLGLRLRRLCGGGGGALGGAGEEEDGGKMARSHSSGALNIGGARSAVGFQGGLEAPLAIDDDPFSGQPRMSLRASKPPKLGPLVGATSHGGPPPPRPPQAPAPRLGWTGSAPQLRASSSGSGEPSPAASARGLAFGAGGGGGGAAGGKEDKHKAALERLRNKHAGAAAGGGGGGGDGGEERGREDRGGGSGGRDRDRDRDRCEGRRRSRSRSRSRRR